MNSILLFLILTGGGTAAAIGGLLLVRKGFQTREAATNHEVGGYMLSVLGTLYAVVLGFVVVDVSDAVRTAKSDISTEINAMMNICRFADGLPQPHKSDLTNSLIAYSDAVAEKEWPLLPKGELCPESWTAMRNIWIAIKNYDPVSQKEQAFYNTILEDYNQMQTSRRNRIVAAAGLVSPVLWLVLIGGAFTTIIFTYFFTAQGLKTQVAMTALVAITLALNLYLVVVYSSPFSGDFKISSISFRIAAKMMRSNGQMPATSMHFHRNFFGILQE